MKLKKITVKEAVSIYELLIMVLCIPPYFMVTWNTTFPFDFYAFLFQSSLFCTGAICLLFGLSTWFYRSKVRATRKQVYILCLVILLELPVCVMISAFFFGAQYAGETIMDFPREIWDDSVLAQFAAAVLFGYVIGALLIILDIFLIINIFWKRKGKKNTL